VVASVYAGEKSRIRSIRIHLLEEKVNIYLEYDKDMFGMWIQNIYYVRAKHEWED